MSQDANETKRSDAATSPAEAQNSGPPHRTPPGRREPAGGAHEPAAAAEPKLPANGKPELRDDA